jgi:putative ABC transport system permease protein
MDCWLQDARRALQALAARPGPALLGVLTLTLGLASTTTLFSVADALLLRPFFYRSPEHIVDFAVQLNGRPANGVYSPAAWRLIQARSDAFAGVEAYRPSNVVMTGAIEPSEISVLETSPGLLSLLGIAPQMGRWFDETDARGGHGPVVVVSDRLWREELGGNPAIVGTTLAFNDTPHTVVGVMPREFVFPRVAFRAWTLLPASLPERPGLSLVGRLGDGVPFDRAASVVEAMRPEIRQVKGTTQDRDAAIAQPQNITTAQRTPIYILLAAVGLVLAMACANVASMTLAVGELRHRELAMCAALGASRARLTRQLVLESAIVAGIAGVAGVWCASLGIDALTAILPSELAFFNANEIRVDRRVMAFGALTVLVAVTSAGVLPALRSTRTDLVDALKSGGRTSTAARGERRALAGLATVQCALALILLISAGVLIRSFVRLQSVDPGFNTERLAIFTVVTRVQRYAAPEANAALRQAVVDALGSTPGVTGVALAAGFPPTGFGFHFEVALEIDAPGNVVARDLEIAFAPVGAGYFDLLGIPLVAGRVVDQRDPVANVVVNEPFARRYWGGAAQAIGHQFRVGPNDPWQTVVGVVGDVKQLGLDDRLGDLEYYRSWDAARTNWSVAVRTTDDPRRLIPQLKARIWSIDPALAIRDSDDMRARFAASVARPRFFLVVMAVFAAIATGIAGLGIYGLFSYLVTRRTTEMGIRLAIGATPSQVAALVVRDGIALAALGAGLGLGGAWAVSRVLASLLFQTSPLDPVVLAVGTTALVTLAIAACVVPARRARAIDPLSLLKPDS